MYYYLKIAAENDVIIKGGSKQADHVDWFEVVTVDRVADILAAPLAMGQARFCLPYWKPHPIS